MNRKFNILMVIVISGLILFNYSSIITSFLSKVHNDLEVNIVYKEDTKPEAMLAEISKVALDSMIKLEDSDLKYIAIDTKAIGMSLKEQQSVLNHFRRYNDKVIHASMKDLKNLGLYNFIKMSLNEGVLLSIDDVIDITEEKAVLKVSYYYSGMGAGGYICTLIYKDSKWQIKSMNLEYIA